jgi:hypothetical protein
MSRASPQGRSSSSRRPLSGPRRQPSCGLRASFTRYASQLDTGLVGFSNPSANAGFAEYPWVDLNGDQLAQPNEVRTDLPVISFGGGFNPAAPTAVTSADVISDTELQRERNIASPNFNRLNQTLSPRIVRFGVRFGF